MYKFQLNYLNNYYNNITILIQFMIIIYYHIQFNMEHLIKDIT